MRVRTISALAAAALIASAASSRAQPRDAGSDADEAQALLRAASTQSAIIVICAKHYAVDGTIALRISQTSRDVAEKVLGRERAAAAFKAGGVTAPGFSDRLASLQNSWSRPWGRPAASQR